MNYSERKAFKNEEALLGRNECIRGSKRGSHLLTLRKNGDISVLLIMLY